MKTDAKIQEDVIQELKWDPSISHEHIGVSVMDGIVTLSGTVPTYLEKSAAEAAAKRVEGVKAVVEKIEVKLPGSLRRTDEDIARAALSALKWNVQVPTDAVKVNVENGTVDLSGDVDWEYQRIAAENAVKNLTGVVWVNNNITIKTKLSPEDIKGKIEDALKRAAEQEARRIQVAVSGHKVQLTGKVRSHAERRDARWAAWSAPGVTDVDDKLEVAA